MGNSMTAAPRFEYVRKLIDAREAAARHGFPQDDIKIYFPTVLKAARHLADSVAKYYLYASPHDHDPGCGIGLWTADTLEGPWRFQRRVIADCQATPAVLYNEGRQKVTIYSHNPNGVNHVYDSDDGIHFEHRNILDFEPAAHGYGSVFPYTFPDGRQVYCGVFWMGDPTPEYYPCSGLYVSEDGYERWECVAPNLYPPARIYTSDPNAPEIANNPEYVEIGQQQYMVFHSPQGIWAYRVDAWLKPVGYEGVFFAPSNMPEAMNCTGVTSPFLIQDENGVWNMLFGGASGGTINLYLARADVSRNGETHEE